MMRKMAARSLAELVRMSRNPGGLGRRRIPH